MEPKTTFTADELRRVLEGFEPAILRMQIQRGLIHIEDRPGKGRARRFTWPETVKVAVMHHLSSSGLGPQVSSQVAEIVAKITEGTEPEQWVAHDFEDEGKAKILFYRVRNEKVEGYFFEKADDVNIESLWKLHIPHGSYFDCAWLLDVLASSLLKNRTEQGAGDEGEKG